MPGGVLETRRVPEPLGPPAACEGAGEFLSKRERHVFLLRALERAQEKLEADVLFCAPPARPQARKGWEGQAKGAGVDTQARERGEREENLRKMGSFQLRLHQMQKLLQIRTAIGEVEHRLAHEPELRDTGAHKAVQAVRPVAARPAPSAPAVVTVASYEPSRRDGAPGTPEREA